MPSLLILTDVDGTLTADDTMFRYLRFKYGTIGFILRFLPLLPVMFGYKVGLISNSTAKTILLSWYLKGETRAALEATGKAFVAHFGTGLLRPKALQAIEGWRSMGADVYMVSASLDIWMRPLADSLGFHAICTSAAYRQDVFTGKFEGENCNGEEKARRILAQISLGNYQEIHVYGDTKGDLPMLALGTRKHWKPFR